MIIPSTNIILPAYLGSSPFSKTLDDSYPLPSDLRKSGSVSSARQEFFINALVGLCEEFPDYVPYQFNTPDGPRRMDKGALKFAHDRGDLTYVVEDGRIIGIRLSRRAIERVSSRTNLALGLGSGSGSSSSIEPPATPNISPEPITLTELSALEIDERVRASSEIIIREGQSKFKSSLLIAYGGSCALLRTSVEAALDAAHVRKYLGAQSNQVWNGVLLRADLHRLFDAGLICFEYRSNSLITLVSEVLKNSSYSRLAGKSVTLPKSRENWPAKAVIDIDRTEKQANKTFFDTPPS